jgi:hypothetical protein
MHPGPALSLHPQGTGTSQRASGQRGVQRFTASRVGVLLHSPGSWSTVPLPGEGLRTAGTPLTAAALGVHGGAAAMGAGSGAGGGDAAVALSGDVAYMPSSGGQMGMPFLLPQAYPGGVHPFMYAASAPVVAAPSLPVQAGGIAGAAPGMLQPLQVSRPMVMGLATASSASSIVMTPDGQVTFTDGGTYWQSGPACLPPASSAASMVPLQQLAQLPYAPQQQQAVAVAAAQQQQQQQQQQQAVAVAPAQQQHQQLIPVGSAAFGALCVPPGALLQMVPYGEPEPHLYHPTSAPLL